MEKLNFFINITLILPLIIFVLLMVNEINLKNYKNWNYDKETIDQMECKIYNLLMILFTISIVYTIICIYRMDILFTILSLIGNCLWYNHLIKKKKTIQNL